MKEMEFHPLTKKCPRLMNDEELSFLVAGMMGGFDPDQPIITFEGKILDGRNRYRAAKEAGVEPAFKDFEGTEEEAEAFVRRRNEDRLHDADAVKRLRQERVERVADKHRSGKSLGVIAEEEGISKTQAWRDLENSGVPRQVTPESGNGKTTGKDGKEYPSTKPPNPKHLANIERDGIADVRQLVADGKLSAADGAKVAALPPAAQDAAVAHLQSGLRAPEAIARASEDVAEEAPPETDALGLPIPPGAADAFAALSAFEEARRAVRQLAERLHDLAELPGGYWFMRQVCERKEKSPGKVRFEVPALRTLMHALKTEQPFTSYCPSCREEGRKKNNKGCKRCLGLPFVGKRQFDSAPDEARAAVESLAAKGDDQ